MENLYFQKLKLHICIATLFKTVTILRLDTICLCIGAPENVYKIPAVSILTMLFAIFRYLFDSFMLNTPFI